jgi:hypothetical protein
MTEYSHQHAEGIGYMVECQSCSAMGEPFAVEGQMPDRHEHTKQLAVAAWNTRARTPDTAPSADLIAEAEDWQARWNSGRVTPGTDVLIVGLVDALRAAEAENARLREALEIAEKYLNWAGDAYECDTCEAASEAARRALGGEG